LPVVSITEAGPCCWNCQGGPITSDDCSGEDYKIFARLLGLRYKKSINSTLVFCIDMRNNASKDLSPSCCGSGLISSTHCEYLLVYKCRAVVELSHTQPHLPAYVVTSCMNSKNFQSIPSYAPSSVRESPTPPYKQEVWKHPLTNSPSSTRQSNLKNRSDIPS